MADENDSGEVESAERSIELNCGKTKNYEYFNENTRYDWRIGRKYIIRGYVNILEESLNEAQVLNNQLLAMLPEHERENPDVSAWFCL